MTIPPYTIPEADADLWQCGVSPQDQILRKQRLCSGCQKPYMKTSAWRCPACMQLQGKLGSLRRRLIKTSPRQNITLTNEQLYRLEKRLMPRLHQAGAKYVRLDPTKGFRLADGPYVGLRSAIIGTSSVWWATTKPEVQQALRTTVVEAAPGYAWEWFKSQ